MSESSQDGPVQDLHPTNDEERIAGIVAQTGADAEGLREERIAEILRQRFADADLEVDDARVAALAADIARA